MIFAIRSSGGEVDDEEDRSGGCKNSPVRLRVNARADNVQPNPSDEGSYRIDDRITFLFPAGDPPNLDLRYSLDGAMLDFSTVGEAERITKTLFTANPRPQLA